MPSIVALDLETTGLNMRDDKITEIGAVRFNGHRIEEEWHSLIHPGRRIPPFITQLTGISDAMVQRAPSIHEVVPDLVNFIGDAPILGHNVRFDLAFLKRHQVGVLNNSIDTYDLAAVLMPRANRYNLGALGQALNIPLPASHRALDDARVTRAVYLQMIDKAMQLSIDLIAEIVRLGENVEWGGDWFFRKIMQIRAKEPIQARPAHQQLNAPIFETSTAPENPLTSEGDGIPLNIEDAAALLEYNGAFAHHFPHFEYRSQQVDMLRAVASAISDGRHFMVEAGTGTGKSLAYLAPAAIWALQNNTRVVISTNTRNLQDQLIHKDIPSLQETLNANLRASVLKGRGNYLCPRRLENMRRQVPESNDTLRVLAKVLVWLEEGGQGDLQEINLNGPNERRVWSHLSAEDDACKTETCLRRMGGSCPFHRAHQAAQSAHLIVVNHALLLADVATGNRILPDYKYLIVDEAHHLESATTNALSYRLTEKDVENLLHELGSSRGGMISRILGMVRNSVTPSQFAEIDQILQRATDLIFRYQNQNQAFFNQLSEFLLEQRDGRDVGNYAHQERILPSTRTQPAWMEVEMVWEDAQNTLSLLIGLMATISEKLIDLLDDGLEDIEDIYGNFGNLFRRFKEMHMQLNALIFKPQADMIYWAEVRPKGGRLSLQAAPLHIGSLMDQYLWHEKYAVILTSATLTTAGEFDYLRGRLNAFDADELALGSPFDYENAALVYAVNDIPEPSDRNGHQKAIEKTILDVCAATGGRALVLFTSYAQLKRTSQAVSPRLAEQEINVYEQGSGASPHALLESFRTDERAVLLGTRSFWEGVDLPGDTLSVLIIVKIPFDVPSDPIVAARSETFEDPFYQYAIPEAILRFRQGFGRLIRTQYDRGMVIILDKRVLSKSYGRAFLDSLPPCSMQTGPLQNIPRVAKQWLNL